MTMADLVTTYATDTSKVAADAAAVAAAQAAEVTDTAQQSTDASTLGAAIATTGPFTVDSSDGLSTILYSPGSTPGTFSTVTYPKGANVPVPVPAPSS